MFYVEEAPNTPKKDGTMDNWITNYICLDISKLREWGYLTLNPDEAFKTGVVSWKLANGETAQVAIGVNLSDEKVWLSYGYNGTKKKQFVWLRFVPSNLPGKSGTGYYYFICPATGCRCRKLYFVNGEFVSRRAFRPLYPQQAYSKKERACGYYLEQWLRIDQLESVGKWKKRHYRGNPTPYTKKLSKYYSRV